MIRLSEGPSGETLAYKLDLLRLEFPETSVKQHEEFHNKLRTLLRVLDNLTGSKNLLLEIGHYLMSNGHNSAFLPPVKAMFCHAVILYGACFLKGGLKRKAPLQYHDLDEQELKVHKNIMDYRDKLFGHLDDNHGVRNDHLFCQFEVISDELKPTFVVRSGNKMALARQAISGEWRRHIEHLIEKVSKEAHVFKAEYENFLKSHSYSKTN